MTKFRHLGKILKVFGHFLRVYLVFGKVLHQNLGNFLCFWAHFYWCTWRNFEQIMQPSGHTGRNPIRVDTRKLFTYLLSTDGQIQIKDYLPRLISKLGRRVNSQRRVVRLGRLRPIHR